MRAPSACSQHKAQQWTHPVQSTLKATMNAPGAVNTRHTNLKFHKMKKNETVNACHIYGYSRYLYLMYPDYVYCICQVQYNRAQHGNHEVLRIYTHRQWDTSLQGGTRLVRFVPCRRLGRRRLNWRRRYRMCIVLHRRSYWKRMKQPPPPTPIHHRVEWAGGIPREAQI